jgi:hypothetical protein
LVSEGVIEGVRELNHLGARDAGLFIIIALLRMALPHGEDSNLIEHHVTAAHHPTSSRIVHQPRRWFGSTAHKDTLPRAIVKFAASRLVNVDIGRTAEDPHDRVVVCFDFAKVGANA